jgi:hypothetical protein
VCVVAPAFVVLFCVLFAQRTCQLGRKHACMMDKSGDLILTSFLSTCAAAACGLSPPLPPLDFTHPPETQAAAQKPLGQHCLAGEKWGGEVTVAGLLITKSAYRLLMSVGLPKHG